MSRQSWHVIAWSLVGIAVSWYALIGAVQTVYRWIPHEPVTLLFGCGLTVISLIGLVRSGKRGPWWCLIPATVSVIAVGLGLVADSTLLLLGLTIPGFY
ncbi:hypothetical protein [Levilactobacillus sp. HBUAS70063]|uniref:hypothetical protein n=1 Tax=Levilactobacillus sp. HBUAS70063 TaxID=3109359 RepID=UPI003132E283